MAEMEQSQFSLMTLEDELSCSICLSPFDCPVTIPCGHNFCQDCLRETWKDSVYSCPQCRTLFATKPQLKRNTVLSSVVETFNLRQSKSEASLAGEESKAEKPDVIHCDICMEAEASQTCLTCMASFCEEHLQPHWETPIFRLHQLSSPVGDLLERICPDHHKLLEFFCSKHGRAICSICLQQLHKGCSFMSPEEQICMKESDLRGKLDFLDGKITTNESVISQIKEMQNKLKDLATNSKKALADEYQQMQDMLAQGERDALNAVDHELESGETRLRKLMMKLTENVDSMNKAKEDIHSLLSQSQTLAFLQASFDLPPASDFDPHTPQINLDSKKLMATQAFAAALKNHLTELFQQPVQARLKILKPDGKTVPVSGCTGCQPECETSDIPRDITSAETRSELLKYATVLTLDPKTAHRRIALSEGFTRASLSKEQLNYRDSPKRFAVCSQVLASKGFSRGRHYWEVRLSSKNFIGIGLAYNSIYRKGPTSRLGRNAQSWCVEWFNVKLSAWYNSIETVLANPNPKRIGVLLDCEEGTATFYSVADRAYPFHSFVFPFSEAVYPAFWTNGSSISLCKLPA